MPSGGRWSRIRHSPIYTLAVIGLTGALILGAAYMANKPAAGEGGGGFKSVALGGTPSGPPPEVGKTAPDFTAKTTDGREVALSGLRGRPVWVTFGASWCQPCRAENPDIQAAYERYRKNGLEILSVFITEDAETVTDYADRVGLTYPKIADPGSRIAQNYRILGIPSHFFVDREGILRVLQIGSLDPEGIDEAIAEIGGDVSG